MPGLELCMLEFLYIATSVWLREWHSSGVRFVRDLLPNGTKVLTLMKNMAPVMKSTCMHTDLS